MDVAAAVAYSDVVRLGGSSVTLDGLGESMARRRGSRAPARRALEDAARPCRALHLARTDPERAVAGDAPEARDDAWQQEEWSAGELPVAVGERRRAGNV
jgi:hypothetical protein